jgi:hypothetical protein
MGPNPQTSQDFSATGQVAAAFPSEVIFQQQLTKNCYPGAAGEKVSAGHQ